MNDAGLIRARWNGEAFDPVGNWPKAWCHDNLEAGELVSFEVSRERPEKSHRHQFAEIREAWKNLPEALADAPYAPSADTLRKHALIATGHCDVQTVDCGSPEAAERIGAMMRADGRVAYGYVIVQIRGPLVKRMVPHSQNYRAMDRAEFQKSKSDVLEWIARLLETTRADLERGAAA